MLDERRDFERGRTFKSNRPGWRPVEWEKRAIESRRLAGADARGAASGRHNTLVFLNIGVVLRQRLGERMRPVIPADEVEVIDVGGSERRFERCSSWRGDRPGRKACVL